MQSYYVYSDENVPSRPTFDENPPLISMHLRTNFMLKQKGVTSISQQLMHMILNCTKGVAKGDNNPMAQSSLQKGKPWKRMAIRTTPPWSYQWRMLKLATICRPLLKRWGVFVTSFCNHLYGIIESWKTWVLPKKRSCVSGLCERNVINWTFDDIHITIIEGCKDHLRKVDTF